MLALFISLITAVYAANPDTIVCKYGTSKLLIQTHQKTNIDLEYPVDNNQARLVIKDTSNFSELEDYLILKNKDGRQVLYAIDCKKI